MILNNINETQKKFLFDAARRYIWWETPEEAMEFPQRILAQIMNIGILEDMGKVMEIFSQIELTSVLTTAEAGQFNERSWYFWHNRFSLETPPMPGRILP